MQATIEQVRSQAPASACFYRLVGRLPGGEAGLFPKDPAAFFQVGEPPYGMTPGLYQIFYFDASGKQILHLRVELQITEPMPSGPFPIETEEQPSSSSPHRNHLTHRIAGEQLALPIQAPGREPRSQQPTPPQADKILSQRRVLEKEQANHQMALERNSHDHAFVQESEHVREIGELAMVSRMMRREILELNKSIQEQGRTTYEDIERQAGAIRLLSQMQKEVLAHAKEMMPTPTQPKVDLVPLGMAALETISAIGSALLQRYPAQPTAKSMTEETKLGASDNGACPMLPRAPTPLPDTAGTLDSKPQGIDWISLPERPESD